MAFCTNPDEPNVVVLGVFQRDSKLLRRPCQDCTHTASGVGRNLFQSNLDALDDATYRLGVLPAVLALEDDA